MLRILSSITISRECDMKTQKSFSPVGFAKIVPEIVQK